MTTSTAKASITALTPADRIAELNEIDKSIAHLLSAASNATAILSNVSSYSASTESNPKTNETINSNSLEEAQEAFRAASSDYFSTLSSIDVRLRRQVYALEEAGLIAAGTERDARRGRTPHAALGSVGAGGADAGVGVAVGSSEARGPLDPSWLNARATDGVEIRKKMELLREAKQLIASLGVLEDVVKKDNNDNNDEGDFDDEMDEGEG